MPIWYTFSKKPFEYEGTMDTELIIYPLDKEKKRTGSKLKIDSETVEFIKRTISIRKDVKMGACRDNPSPRSLGEALKEKHKSPQWLSYILPLLEKTGFLTYYKEGRAFCVKKIS